MNKLESFENVLRKVYDHFFSSLVKDHSTGKYFAGKDTEKIKKEQIQGILYLYELFVENSREKLKKELINLGKRHENLGIDFSLFVETINKLELMFIKELFSYKITEIEKTFFETSRFFDILRNYTAVGYLKEYVKREKVFLKDFIESNFHKKSIEIKDIIDRHILWKEKVLEYLAEETRSADIEIDPNICEMGVWLETVKEKNPEVVERLITLHTELHHIAENIISLKKEGRYVLLVNEYNYLVKTNLLFLSGLLAFLLSEKISELQRDPLTDLLTRRVLENIYINVMELSLITEEPFGLAFIDVDNFKKVNDTYGHEAGDIVLTAIARILKRNLRKSDYLFRYGGEEFIVIVPATSEKSFKAILEKLRKKIEQEKIKINGKEIQVTVSIGGVIIRKKEFIPLKEVIKRADALMYQAKKAGKNRVFIEVYE
ncbi:sensor domain-containing diguanylate cyclase [Persephonella sp.]